MSQLPKIGRYSFRVEQYQCNVRKMLRFSSLVNIMLSAADYHSTERGFGTIYLNEMGKTWVLSRLAVEMERIPSRHQEITIETWIDKVHPLFTSRNFRALSKEGEVLGWGRSVWAMIDTTTRHPVDLMEIHNGLITTFIVNEDDKEFLNVPIDRPAKIQLDEPSLFRIDNTYFSDVDFNGHINSMRYVDHVLDIFPLSWHKKNNIKRLDIAFIAEGRPEVPIKIYGTTNHTNAVAVGEDNHTDYLFKIMQDLPENSEESEACRLRLRTIPLVGAEL
ncbi:MAG: acyl-[Bacteroidales bacterium]|nr:acyl-[acyl-carrier-protein] thioesterase [Bacteroidales bacterium]